MALLRLNRFRRPTTTEWVAGGVTLVAILAYLFVLRALDHRAERYFVDLRESDPATYLTQLREAKGFDAYLPEYAEIARFSDFRQSVPDFLIGRWTMREEMLRLTPGQAPGACSDPATFEFGLYLAAEAGGPAVAVQYRIEGDAVEMRTDDGTVIPIHLAGYGSQVDHIEFTPPGRDTSVFAYLCGR